MLGQMNRSLSETREVKHGLDTVQKNMSEIERKHQALAEENLLLKKELKKQNENTVSVLHYREYRKSQEISDILRIQAEIEFKRTSLMVVYQEVLQSVVKELDAMKHGRIEMESQELSRLLDSLPDEIELQEAQP